MGKGERETGKEKRKVERERRDRFIILRNATYSIGPSEFFKF
jgi:hypothetical protein